MKSILPILASLSLAALVAGCVATAGMDASEEPAAEEHTGEANQALIKPQIWTYTYYSDATHSTVVGGCVIDNCPPHESSTCSGEETQYSTYTTRPCP